MNHSDNNNNMGIIVKNIADYVGYSSGEKYFNDLIDAINKYTEFSFGFLYYLDNELFTLIASSKVNNTELDDIASLDSSVIERILLDDLHNVIIDVESDLNVSSISNPLNFKSLVTFPLHNSDNSYSGIIILASTNELISQKPIIDAIDTQIPRAASELERLLVKKKLVIFENNYNNLVNSTLDAIWEADITGHITKINSTCKAIYGYSEKHMIGRCYTEFMTETSASNFAEYLPLLEKGNSIYNVPSDHISKANEPIKVCYNIIPKYDENNSITGIIGTTRDISASVRAEETIKNNSELFSSILSGLPVIFFKIDENGHFVDIRGNGLKRMGVKDMDWVGRPGYGLFLGMDSKIDSALAGNTVFFENKGTYKGTTWWFYTSMFFDSWSGNGAVGFSVDITKQKYVEEQLVDLLHNNRMLAQKLVEVQEDERRNLARELHDELGQSITAVKSLATVITANSGNQYTEIRSLANSIIDLSGRLYEVVNNIMQRLRPDIIDNLDFNETINNCIVRSQLETIGVNCNSYINTNINDLDEFVKVTIYRIVQECLTNISKHAMASNVTIRIQRDYDDSNLRRTRNYDAPQSDNNDLNLVKRDTIRIEISDDGIGMDVNKTINNREHTKRHGLQGIYERVTAMGGTLKITGKPGNGVNIQAVLVLGSNNHDVSHDIDESVPNFNKMCAAKTVTKKINTH